MHKVYVGNKGGYELSAIADKLKEEWVPDYLNAGGSAAAEASLVLGTLPTEERIALIDTAEDCWTRALHNQSDLNDSREKPWLIDDMNEFRTALNLAYVPLIRAIVAGDVDKQTREKVFADTVAIAQTSAVQHRLALMSNNPRNQGVAGAHVGFGHECNALLAFLYNDDPNFVPLPSTFRAGTGYTYKSQTHDLAIVNQNWGVIRSIIPTEIKARIRTKHKERYKALMIRGKLHLVTPGDRHPFTMTEAFAACYDETATDEQAGAVKQATTTVKDLLLLYRKGETPEEFQHFHTPTRFHERDVVAAKYRELAS